MAMPVFLCSIARSVAGCSLLGGLLLTGCSAYRVDPDIDVDKFGMAWQRFTESRPSYGWRIAEALGQPMLRRGDDEFPARQLMVAVDVPFDSVRNAIHRRLVSEYGINTDKVTLIDVKGMFEAITPDPEESSESLAREGKSLGTELEQAGIAPRQIRLHELTSQPFNLGVVNSSSSTISIRIVDAATLGNSVGAIVFLQRIDRYDSFTAIYPHILLPRWMHLIGALVTTSERTLVLKVLEDLGSPRVKMYTSKFNFQNKKNIVDSTAWFKTRG